MTGGADVASLQRAADFIRSAADWTWETDASLRITALSSGVVAVVGRPARSYIGTPLAQLGQLADGPLTRRPLPKLPFADQYVTIGSGLTTRHYSLSGTPLFDSAKELAGYAGTAREVENVPTLQPEFLASVGRGFRDPLHSIIGLAEALSHGAQAPLAGRYADYARDIVQSGRHLLSFVDGTLLSTQERDLEHGRIVAGEVVARAAAIVALAAEAKRIAMELPSNGNALVLGDEGSACQILVNLLGNAVKFTPEGGRITVGVASIAESGQVEIWVQDSGPGIAESDQERIFGKFERVGTSSAAMPGSVGLGLHISRELAERMGGTLVVDSRPGQGARFALRLPAA